MKIALVGAINSPINKNSSAGTEIWTYNFAETLIQRGQDVTLFASEGSEFSGKFIEVSSPKDILDSENKISIRKFPFFCISQMIEVLKNQDQFDIIHLSVFNLSYALPFVKIINKPIVITVHDSLPKDEETEYIFNKFSEPTYIFISKNQGKFKVPPKKYEIIYNGIKTQDFSFNNNSGQKNLFWINRISPEKGAEDAIKIAKITDKNIKLGGPIRDPKYFDKSIKPFLDNQVKYLGPLDFNNKINYYQQAKLLLMPIHWEEPFGLVMIEAMACGTPVVAYNRGAVSEIIKDNETGFICPPEDINCMVSSVKKIYEMPEKEYQSMRLACRRHVEKNFTIDKMVEGYEKVYQKILNSRS